MKHPHAFPALLLLIGCALLAWALYEAVQIQEERMTPEVDIDVKPLAEIAYRRSRVLQAEVLASVRRFQESTGLVVEAIDVQQSEITRLGKREMLPGVKVKVVL